MQKENIKIIGLGGVGTALCENLCRYLNYKEDKEITITFIDGDEYEAKNRQRQSFPQLGNKATVKRKEMRDIFRNLKWQEVREYVGPENIETCIKDGDIIFSCVDNHKTRKVISEFASRLNNILLISGGNEWTDGNVQIYSRKEGKNVTPSLTDYHPEILNPVDQSPDEMSCEELSKSDPQLLFTNLSVATLMCWAYYNEVEKKKSGVSEVYFDIEQMALDAKVREPKF